MTDKHPSPNLNRYPFYSPRFWHGMDLPAYLRLLAAGRWHVAPSRLPMAAILFGVTSVNSVGGALQRLMYGRAVSRHVLERSPLFILGHWRSGTTLLHELLMMDHRFAAPTTYQCFAPHHFLLSEGIFTRCCGWMLPRKRPMDNMAAGWRKPQEDEFALMNLGLPSPYRRIAFPNEPPMDMDLLDWRDIPPELERRWLASLKGFIQSVSYRAGKPLVLKSPTHTGRLGLLHRQFANAKFIHITRDPRSLFPSTRRLWQSLDEVQGFQVPSGDALDDYVIQCGRRMYDAFHRARPDVPDEHIVDCRYEDLVTNPLEELRRIYQAVNLPDFAEVEPVIDQWVREQHRHYRTNVHSLSPALEKRLRSQWGDYFKNYGYDSPVGTDV